MQRDAADDARGESGAAVDAELQVHVRSMRADSERADAETSADRLAVESLGNQHSDLQLASRQDIRGRNVRIRLVGADRVATLAERHCADDADIARGLSSVFWNDEANLPID